MPEADQCSDAPEVDQMMDETRQDDTQDFGTERGLGTQHAVETRAEGASSSTDDVTLRFGPGVPPALAGVWRDGSPRRRPLSRRVFGGLLTLGLAILTGLVVWWLLRSGPSVQVTGVIVTAPSEVRHCGATTTVVGEIHTNGGQGEVSYRWRRSDGQFSGVFTDSLSRGRHSVRVPLRWTIQGAGDLHAVATLEVLSPKSPDGTASGAFDYRCH
ncbi:MAG: hypothetical protein JWP48_7323 [Actinoallomurus sp.]|jgi:hypothetical protein|nr:hypothetical protein [Actinoallomurus sp.]